MPGHVDFWFEFASTYSYLAAARIEVLAAKADVTVAWRPFLLGPIFALNGWTTSPFNIFEAKGRAMWRDMERLTSVLNLPFSRPALFPQNGLKASRLALALPDGPRRAAFVRAVYSANFARGELIADDVVLRAILNDLGENPSVLLEAAASADIKASLKANTDKAVAAGIFGAPSFVTPDGELFWGNDRLEMALNWANTSSGEKP